MPRGLVSMRMAYAEKGVQGYYAEHGTDYRNPHFPEVASAIHSAMSKHLSQHFLIPNSPLRLLDLACGSGEATEAVRSWAQKEGRSVDAVGMDPFTSEAYKSRTGIEAEPVSFEDIQAGALQGRSFDVCICSFALHLVEESRMFELLNQLALSCDYFMIVSPHKKPEIKQAEASGWFLQDQFVHQRIHVRLFKSLLR